jgi:hypothetical protein
MHQPRNLLSLYATEQNRYCRVCPIVYFWPETKPKRQSLPGCAPSQRISFLAKTTNQVQSRNFPCTRPQSRWQAGVGANSPSSLLPEKPQHIGEKANRQHSTEPYACTSASAPAAVAVVSSTQAENQHKNDNKYEHLSLSSLRVVIPGYATDFTFSGVCAWTSSSKSVRYWIIAVRRSSVLASSVPGRAATACAKRYCSTRRGCLTDISAAR